MSFHEKIKKIYRELRDLPDLIPSPLVNRLFTELVSEVVKCFDQEADLTEVEVAHLQTICAQGEYELEKHWAHEILTSSKPRQRLIQFPYLKNYHDLTRLEWLSFQGCQSHSEHQVLFCGGGPMPLTAIVLAEKFGISSTVIDNNEEAVHLSTELIEKLGLSHMITVLPADAEHFDNYASFTVIFIAALAGLVPSAKEMIFSAIREKAQKNTHLIARSSWGNRKLLYRPLPEKAYKYFEPVLQVDPYTDIVNSVVILKKT